MRATCCSSCAHLGKDPAELAVVEMTFPRYQRANLQLAMEKLLRRKGVKWSLQGVVQREDYERVTLAKLSRERSAAAFSSGPVEYHRALTDTGSLSCVQRGLFLIRTKAGPVAVLVNEGIAYPPVLVAEVMARTLNHAQDFASKLDAATMRAPADRTVMVLTGGGMGAIESSGTLARALAPATVILEDVDLIGTQREHQTVNANALLFELLNQMDGLTEDADVLFVLTTNRPDVLEPALASRPGRIDQAIEIPLPDAACRRRLLDLYSTGLDIELEDTEGLIERTKGVSAAFMRELLRKAALLAMENEEAGMVVRDEHASAALDELLLGGALTKRPLGVRVEDHGR